MYCKKGDVRGSTFISNRLMEAGEGVPRIVGTRDWDAEGKSTGEN